MNAPPLPLISVCICTYNRPALLEELLASLATQCTAGRFNIEVVIVDNDHRGNAKAVVDAVGTQYPLLRMKYAIEPTQGIAFARNQTVALASGHYLAFIDDDEKASPRWLAEMLTALRDYRADAVFGPVIPLFPEGSAQWIVAGHFFDRPRHATGALIDHREARTSNAMIRRQSLPNDNMRPFNEKLAHSGGEDYDFFQRIGARGARMIWCDAACVTEWIPLARQSPLFLLRRRLRSSVTFWRLNYARLTNTAITREVFAGLGGFPIMALVSLIVAPFSSRLAMTALIRSMGALGRIVALSNIRFVGYPPS